jgi:Nucleotidyl transferase AbiEii toxin, Type IV TA system
MNLYYSTISPLLLQILKDLMARKEFSVFRLVGGTALSLMRGHRISVDLDLFTDEEYGSVDFGAIDGHLRRAFPYVDTMESVKVSIGKS